MRGCLYGGVPGGKCLDGGVRVPGAGGGGVRGRRGSRLRGKGEGVRHEGGLNGG